MIHKYARLCKDSFYAARRFKIPTQRPSLCPRYPRSKIPIECNSQRPLGQKISTIDERFCTLMHFENIAFRSSTNRASIIRLRDTNLK